MTSIHIIDECFCIAFLTKMREVCCISVYGSIHRVRKHREDNGNILIDYSNELFFLIGLRWWYDQSKLLLLIPFCLVLCHLSFYQLISSNSAYALTYVVFRKSLLKSLLKRVIILSIQNLICVLLNGGLLLIRFVIKKEKQWLLFSVVVACLYSPMIQGTSSLRTYAKSCRTTQPNNNYNIMTMLGSPTTFNVSAKTKRLVTEH